jgi:phenylacetate-coenzyme A ligase PaaK-like adenylate-forming protein
VIGSERWSEKMRKYIREELGIELYDIYGLTEIYGPGIGINSRRERRSSASAHMIFPELSPKSVRAAAVIHGLT